MLTLSEFLCPIADWSLHLQMAAMAELQNTSLTPSYKTWL